MSKIIRENKTEHFFEKRAKELKRRGYGEEAITNMMYSKGNNIRSQHIRKWLKHEISPGEMVMDGKL